jgi:hypothetical protein
VAGAVSKAGLPLAAKICAGILVATVAIGGVALILSPANNDPANSNPPDIHAPTPPPTVLAEPEPDPEPDDREQTTLDASWAAAYREILLANADDINAYYWGPNNRVALVNLLGNDVPELVFMKAHIDEWATPYAELSIYTYDGSARRILTAFMDPHAGGGASYTVFLTNMGELYTVTGTGNWAEDLTNYRNYAYHYSEFVMVNDLQALIDGDETFTRNFTLNEGHISENQYNRYVQAIIDSAESIIIGSICAETEGSEIHAFGLPRRLKSLSVTFEVAIQYLQSQISGS